MVRLTILASGSSGNCAFLETPAIRILIDAGLSARQVAQRLEPLGRTLDDIDAVFITHEHSDHVRGLGVLARRRGLPVHCNRKTMEFLRPGLEDYAGWRLFETGATVLAGDLQVETFPVSHDAYDPVGFLFRHPYGAVGFLTDLGHATKLVVERVRTARALVLEANHCVQLLHADTRRPWSVKQRILSRHGHLSNDAAAALAVEIAAGGLEDLFLGHLSDDCNRPELAAQVIGDKLREHGHAHIRLHQLIPDQPAPSLCWEGESKESLARLSALAALERVQAFELEAEES